jgi:hypothetical protein
MPTFNHKILASVLLLLAILTYPLATSAQNSYYFPESEASGFNEDIPSPAEFLGYEIGTHYTRHDRMVAYFKALAEQSEKASLQVIGETYEKRLQIVLTISSAENQDNIEQIRKQHLTLVDPEAPALEPAEGKSVVALNYSVHGDETSSGEAALLTAYYLIANESAETQQFLDEGVVHIDPSQNPDGRDRAAHWHNSFKSSPPVADPADAEHNQDWPRGRTNHFLHDLNRDWFAITQQESANRVNFYHQWYPNVQIDFHEMGTDASYYLEPTKPVRTWNPIIPEYQYEVMNPLLAEYQTEALDQLGALYWTKEIFDNISPIYGSTYPDILGGVGSTFEVGSSRGLVQESDAGEVTFRSTIRRHLHTGIATVRAAVSEKEKLFEYQKDFFQSATDQAAEQPVRAYVFGDEEDPGLTQQFLDLLLKHHLEVYAADQPIETDKHTYAPGSSYVVPADQKQYRIIHDIFKPNTSFPDSVFYDITGWSLVQGYGLRYGGLESDDFEDAQGGQITSLPALNGGVQGQASDYAYLLNISNYNAYSALYALLDKGIIARAAYKPFTAATDSGDRDFSYGDIVIAAQEQPIPADSLYRTLQKVADRHHVTFYGTQTGYTPSGIDLGSRNIKPLQKPEVALVVGAGTNSYEVGEAWFLLNEHVHLPATKLRAPQLPSTDLRRYNTLILVDGNYSSWQKATVKKIKQWVQAGGTLITDEDAAVWAIESNLAPEELLAQKEDTTETPPRYDYVEQSDRRLAATIPGTILQADIDPSHPIAFGSDDRQQLFIKDNRIFLNPNADDPYATVARYTEEPFVGGHISDENLEKVKGTAAIVTASLGQGNVILFAENPNFRSYWHTTSRLFLNSIFFGQDL